jgi:isoleucyl-tRNA synthetase
VALIEDVATRIEGKGVDAWFELEASELLGDEADQYEKVTDTLDVWFDSGVTHACVLRDREGLSSPADLYLEGSDQHRGWFQSSLLTGIGAFNESPYRQVLTHGFTVDGEGRKMSKSIGNIIPAKKAMNDMGADILRLWVSSADYRNEIAASDEIFKRTSDTYRRIRNTARFLLANLAGFEPTTDLVESSELLPLDRWIVSKTQGLQTELIEAYDTYQFHHVYHKVHNFCSGELGGFYLDVIKDRQYTTQTNSLARRSCQTALYHMAEAISRWIAPVLSFTAEEIWENLPGGRAESVFLAEWYKLPVTDSSDVMGDAFWTTCLAVRQDVNKAMEAERAAGNIRGSLDASVVLYVSDELKASLATLGDELRFVLITSGAELANIADAPTDVSANVRTGEIEGLKVVVSASEAEKCDRCWHRRDDVGSHAEHPTLCGRCVSNVAGDGETRHFA